MGGRMLRNTHTKLESVMAPYQGVISAYGIARVQVIGDCGEPVDEMTSTRTTWTEYRNGFGHFTGSSGEVTTSRDLTVPKGFGSIVAGNGNPEVGVLVKMNLGPIVRALGCDSIERRRMEANMLAFFNGRPPAYKAKVGEQREISQKP